MRGSDFPYKDYYASGSQSQKYVKYSDCYYMPPVQYEVYSWNGSGGITSYEFTGYGGSYTIGYYNNQKTRLAFTYSNIPQYTVSGSASASIDYYNKATSKRITQSSNFDFNNLTLWNNTWWSKYITFRARSDSSFDVTTDYTGGYVTPDAPNVGFYNHLRIRTQSNTLSSCSYGSTHSLVMTLQLMEAPQVCYQDNTCELYKATTLSYSSLSVNHIIGKVVVGNPSYELRRKFSLGTLSNDELNELATYFSVTFTK